MSRLLGRAPALKTELFGQLSFTTAVGQNQAYSDAEAAAEGLGIDQKAFTRHGSGGDGRVKPPTSFSEACHERVEAKMRPEGQILTVYSLGEAKRHPKRRRGCTQRENRSYTNI